MIFRPTKALAWFDFPVNLTRFKFDTEVREGRRPKDADPHRWFLDHLPVAWESGSVLGSSDQSPNSHADASLLRIVLISLRVNGYLDSVSSASRGVSAGAIER